MAEAEIIQGMILQPGQSQGDRAAAELGVHYADVDERSSLDLLGFTASLAQMVNFRRNDPTFYPGDFQDLGAFAAKVKTPADPISSLVNSRFANPTLQDLAAWSGSGAVPDMVPAALTAELNRIISGPPVYDKVLFAGVALRPETSQFLAANPTGNDLALLNRLLLEDAFPSELKAGTWTSVLGFDKATPAQLLARVDGAMPAHAALLLSFLELYKQPQGIINQVTGRHLDFYYRRVLQLPTKPAVPDKVHLVLGLKKQAAFVNITPANVFTGGKDPTGVELLYAPTGQTIINQSSVASLRSVFVDRAGRGTVRYAPVANSSNGTGGSLDPALPKWKGFGSAALPPAEIGFALASPVLRMLEGTRTVSAKLAISGFGLSRLRAAALRGAFNVYVTGVKGWLGPYAVTPALRGGLLEFSFTVPDTEKAVIDYDVAIHGYSYIAQAPVMQVLLNTDAPSRIGYLDFAGIVLNKAQVSVDVKGVKTLDLESDSGKLDPTKAFQPFGPLPTVGSTFMIGCDEALSKKLTSVAITVNWKGAQKSFPDYYAGYTNAPTANSDLTASVAFKDGGSWVHQSPGEPLFNDANATTAQVFSFSPNAKSRPKPITTEMRVRALRSAGRPWSVGRAGEWERERPVLTPGVAAVPEDYPGYITFALETDFLRGDFRKEYVTNLMTYGKTGGTLTVLNDPYTPAVQTMSLDYSASSDDVAVTNLGADSQGDFANPDLQFYLVAYFGQMREHSYQRQQFDFLNNKAVSLFPVYDNEGELLVGLANLGPGDSVSALFQVAEGSADPDLAQETVVWSVLCDNYWMPLKKESVVLDTTNQLLASGIIRFLIPEEATTDNTILPAGQLWLKAGVAKNVTAVCQLVDVEANAIEAAFADHGNDPNHLVSALPANTIAKLKTGLAAVKTIAQPYASSGGCPAEADGAYYTRVSERLRHKDRCITPWDYERIILGAFPGIHRVKCIPHARKGSWFAPGSVLIVVVPDLTNKNAVDPLQPKADLDTISRITSWVQDRAWAQCDVSGNSYVTVKNPNYQKIRLDFKVSFLEGFEFNFYSQKLKQQLIQFLSPWAYASDADINFGGTIYKSVLLDFVQDIGYVDYVTDFKMYSYSGSRNQSADLDEAQPETPDTILVSDSDHDIASAT